MTPSEPLTLGELAALRDFIEERATTGGAIAARNAVRLLATLDATRAAAGIDVERLARAIADHHDICSRMAIPECAPDIAAEYARLTQPTP